MDKLPFTQEAKKLLKSFWDETDLEEWAILLEDPARFIKDIANPFLRDLQSKKKDVPIFQRSRDGVGNLLIKTSWER